MEFLPSAFSAASMLDCGPLALVDDRQPGAVDDEMDGPVRSGVIQPDIEMPTAAKRVVWSGASRSMPIIEMIDRRKPSAWRSGRLKTNRSIKAVSIAWSEDFLCPPRPPDGAGFQSSIASSEIHRVTSPRCTSAWSYSAQLLTRYFVLYLGWTLDFMRGSWPIKPVSGQDQYRRAILPWESCTNAS